MKLYQDSRAPNPRRVRIFAAEKAIRLDTVTVDLATRENEGEAHLARHPLGHVPVLELDDGRLLRESMAICRYLDALAPEPPLFGQGAYDRAIVEQWNRHMEFELLVPVALSFRNTHEMWADRIEQFPDFGRSARGRALETLGWLEAELADRDYIAGERFSVADITAFCALEFARVARIRLGDEHPRLAAWRERVAARPASRA